MFILFEVERAHRNSCSQRALIFQILDSAMSLCREVESRIYNGFFLASVYLECGNPVAHNREAFQQ